MSHMVGADAGLLEQLDPGQLRRLASLPVRERSLGK